MSQDVLLAKPNCFVEFRVQNKERFELLRRFFEPLRAWTRNQAAPDPGSEMALIDAGMSADQTQEHLSLAPREDTIQRHDFAKPEEWLLAFRPADLTLLDLPAHADSIKTLREWQGLSRRERRKLIQTQPNEKQLRILADFVDMLTCWQDVEYELVSLEMQDSDLGRLTYSTYDFPFAGKNAIEEMLMFFGFFSIVKDTC